MGIIGNSHGRWGRLKNFVVFKENQNKLTDYKEDQYFFEISDVVAIWNKNLQSYNELQKAYIHSHLLRFWLLSLLSCATSWKMCWRTLVKIYSFTLFSSANEKTQFIDKITRFIVLTINLVIKWQQRDLTPQPNSTGSNPIAVNIAPVLSKEFLEI